MSNKYQIDVISCSIAALSNRLDRNIILGEDVCRRSQNTAAIGNHKTDVVLRMEVLNGKDRQLISARASNNGLDAHLQMTSDLKHITHYGASSRTRSGAFTEEHVFARSIAYGIDRVEHAVNHGKLMAFGNHRGMNANIDTRIGAVCVSKELHCIAHFVSHSQVDRRNTTDAFREYLIHGYTGVEGDGSQDGNLGGGIKAVDVSCGIGFRKALFLGFLQRIFIAHAVFVHARDHIVGGTVHDTHD